MSLIQRLCYFIDCFTEHPASAGQTYFEHLCHAWKFAFEAEKASCMFFLHGLFPWCCEFSGSDAIKVLNTKLQAKRLMILETQQLMILETQQL